MYYLKIRVMGVEKCIARSNTDIYRDNQSYDCNNDLYCNGRVFLRQVTIHCIQLPGTDIIAEVYMD